MNWKMIKRDTTPVVLGIAMIVNFILSVSIALWMGTALRRHNQSATLAVIVGFIIFLIIGIFLFWISALIMDDSKSEYLPNGSFLLENKHSAHGEIQMLSGVYQGCRLEMQEGESIILGSNPRVCQLVFDTKMINEKHCCIYYDVQTQEYLITDYSALGIFLENGSRLPKKVETRLSKGSILQLGYSDNYLKLA